MLPERRGGHRHGPLRATAWSCSAGLAGPRVPWAPGHLREVDWEAAPWTPEQRFDAVLVDAPCTALGTTRRHPELRWTRKPTDPPRWPSGRRASCAARWAPSPRRPVGLRRVLPGAGGGQRPRRRLLERHPELRLELELLSFAPPSQDEDAHYAAKLRRTESP
ncbi:MAG: hypothetical protein H6741_33110 [Alphaproteobacteria bacterium]|nr:hypothetical protein [Alphaproteobacteria bacterium]